MELLLTIADNLEPWHCRINMQHQRKTKRLTLFDQIVLRFKLEVSYSDTYNLLLPVSLVIKIIIIIIIIIFIIIIIIMKMNKMRIMLLMIMMTMTMIMAMTMILVAIFFYDNDNNIVTRNCFLSKQHEASFLARVNSQPSQALVTSME